MQLRPAPVSISEPTAPVHGAFGIRPVPPIPSHSTPWPLSLCFPPIPALPAHTPVAGFLQFRGSAAHPELGRDLLTGGKELGLPSPGMRASHTKKDMVRFVFCDENSRRYVSEVRDGEAGGYRAIDYGNEPGKYGWSSIWPRQWGGEKGLEEHLERRSTGLGDYLGVRVREKEET